VCRVYFTKLFFYIPFLALSNLSLFTQHTRHSYCKAASYKRFRAPSTPRAARLTLERPAHYPKSYIAPSALGAKGKARSARKRIRLSLAKSRKAALATLSGRTLLRQPDRPTTTARLHSPSWPTWHLALTIVVFKTDAGYRGGVISGGKPRMAVNKK
jgi:hypothetical protein